MKAATYHHFDMNFLSLAAWVLVKYATDQEGVNGLFFSNPIERMEPDLYIERKMAFPAKHVGQCNFEGGFNILVPSYEVR